MRPIRIVATEQAARTLGVGTPVGGFPAPFEVMVDVDEMADPLAGFLASNITSTDSGDPGSLVRIVHPWTTAEARLREAVTLDGEAFLGNGLAVAGAITRLRRRLDDLEREIATRGASMFESVVTRYDWPVFGSVRGGWSHGARTVEAYFDHCAREIRNMRGLVMAVGVSEERPSGGLLRHLTAGQPFDASALIAHYDLIDSRRRRERPVALLTE